MTRTARAMFERQLNNLAVEDFPCEGTHAQQLRALVQYAIRAPSSYNSQPWRFRVMSHALEVLADRSRVLPVADPDHRELTIGCGAALEFAVIALRHFGQDAAVHLLPDPGNPDLLASLEIGIPHTPDERDEALFAAMFQRHTSRRVFESRLLPPSLRSSLKSAATHHGAWFKWVGAAERPLLVKLVMQGDRLQMADQAFRRELSVWLRRDSWNTPDGLQGYGPGPEGDATVFPIAARTFDRGNGLGAGDDELADGSPEIGILGTERDTTKDWLRTGRALAQVLLSATAGGVRYSFLNQPVQVASLRSRLKALAGNLGIPQLVLRLGYGLPGQVTPRRTVSDVLI